MIRLRHILAATMLTAAVSSFGAPIDEAKKLYRSGQYEAAIEKLRPLLKRSPKDGTVNYYLGASLMATGERSAAVAPLKQAASRGVADASRLLAEYAIDEYRVDDADNYLEAWETQLKKSKKSVPEDFDQLSSRVVQLRNMLDRVEKIEIVDSLCVDSAMFFQAYRLSKEAGRLLPPEAVRRIGAGDGTSQLSVAYMPENHTEILWSAAGDDGMFRLYGADILDDGTIAHPAPLDDSLGEGGNAKFPFLMPDGVTLYFANDGENSLGGYDIFMTRRNDGENGERTYYQPQNIGMPYNSPFNDYMLAIDEMSGLGWWATDRNAAPGKVNIYIYIPS
ncbi:MAG: hypothetical protein K2F63_05540, partial [Muribaculaceae bacterium]|nr:hypothetical protein [Muribaculaceae bacterium]